MYGLHDFGLDCRHFGRDTLEADELTKGGGGECSWRRRCCRYGTSECDFDFTFGVLGYLFVVGGTFIGCDDVTCGFEGSEVPKGIMAEVLLEGWVGGAEFCEIEFDAGTGAAIAVVFRVGFSVVLNAVIVDCCYDPIDVIEPLTAKEVLITITKILKTVGKRHRLALAVAVLGSSGFCQLH